MITLTKVLVNPRELEGPNSRVVHISASYRQVLMRSAIVQEPPEDFSPIQIQDDKEDGRRRGCVENDSELLYGVRLDENGNNININIVLWKESLLEKRLTSSPSHGT